MANASRLVLRRNRFVLDNNDFTVCREREQRWHVVALLRFATATDTAPASCQILAGCIHYFRIHPDQWSDRLARLRAMGLNAIQTCAHAVGRQVRIGPLRPTPLRRPAADVPWNWHESAPGVIDLSSPSRDLFRFLRLAQFHGLKVVLRPGPYAPPNKIE